MNSLSVLQQETATMSSREIAKLCEKQHYHVKRDIETMFEQLEMDVSKFGYIYLDGMNRQQTEYLLNKDLTLTLVSGYNVKVRHAIIQRWQELENQQPKLDLPQDYLSALKALVASEEQKQLLAIENARLQEQSDTLAKISHAKDSQNVRDTAKALDINQNKFVAWCLTNDWLYRDDSGKLKAYQNRINQGFLTQKPVLYQGSDGSERVTMQPMFTAKAIVHLANKFFRNGVL